MPAKSQPLANHNAAPSAARVWFAFGLVYLFWGSTYLAISVAVRGIPPALMCAVRFLIAGTLVLAWCAVSGRPVRITWHDAWRLAVVGVLLLTGGNALVAWAEQYTPTGISALIVASVPLWVLVFERGMKRGERLSRRGLGGLGLGIVGIVLLLWPDVRAVAANGAAGNRNLLAGAGVLLVASCSWALGSICSHRFFAHGWQPQPGAPEPNEITAAGNALSATGWEMVFAGLANLLIALAFGQEHRAVWTAGGMGAIAYLVVFGSWVGYTAYIWLLNHVPTAKVATYAYVNPVVAVFLGWAILHERVDGYVLAGTGVIVAAVVMVTTANIRREGEPHAAPGALGQAEARAETAAE